MNGGTPRSFNCKNEELPVISGFVSISFKRDQPDFTAFSPLFVDNYVVNFDAKIAAVQELVQPKSETVEGKMIGEHTDLTLQEMITLINHLEGYVNLAGKTIPMKAADFGLVQLRTKVRSRDVEGVLNLIHAVENNMKRYQTELSEKGMTEAFAARFTQAGLSLADDKNKRYMMVSNRAALVQNNIAQLNDLYDQLIEICNIGKILYKKNNPAKLNDYTISFLLNQVRRNFKPNDTPQDKPANPMEE